MNLDLAGSGYWIEPVISEHAIEGYDEKLRPVLAQKPLGQAENNFQRDFGLLAIVWANLSPRRGLMRAGYASSRSSAFWLITPKIAGSNPDPPHPRRRYADPVKAE